MFEVRTTGRYLKDLKRMLKRGLPKDELDDVVRMLSMGDPLPFKYKDHALTGNWAGYRECHVRPDWLLVYKIDDNTITLLLTRTGTHEDIF